MYNGPAELAPEAIVPEQVQPGIGPGATDEREIPAEVDGQLDDATDVEERLVVADQHRRRQALANADDLIARRVAGTKTGGTGDTTRLPFARAIERTAADPELVNAETALYGLERPAILPALRPEEPLTTWRFDLEVPIAKQVGNKTNCGPTVAAKAVAAYDPEAAGTTLHELRDLIGEWTWQAFPMRQMRLPGYDAALTTRHMMKTSMERFRPEVGWHPVEHLDLTDWLEDLADVQEVYHNADLG